MLGLVWSGAGRDELGGRLAGGGEVELVLHDLEEPRALRSRGLVVGSQREDLLDPQVHPALARPDVPDALQELVEVVGHPGAFDGRVLQPLVVHREALHEVLAQAGGGPAPELDTSG